MSTLEDLLFGNEAVPPGVKCPPALQRWLLENFRISSTGGSEELLLSEWFTYVSALVAGDAKGADVASAASIALGTGRLFHITGSTGPVTAMTFTAPQDGRWALLVFDSTPTLQTSANLTIHGGDYTAAAGDMALLVQDTSTQCRLIPFRVSGKPVRANTAAEITSTATGFIAATTVQGALAEIAAEVAQLAGAAFTGAVSVTGAVPELLTLTQTDNGSAAGPVLTLARNSASPATSDVVGLLRFSARDSAGNLDTYAQIYGTIVDPTTTSEDLTLSFDTIVAGALAPRLAIGAGLYHPSVTGGDKGANTLNFGQLYENNARVAVLTGAAFTGAVTITGTTESLLNYTMNEDGAGYGPDLRLTRVSASPAANDGLGRHIYYGRTTTPATIPYVITAAQIVSPTGGAEASNFSVQTYLAGALAQRLIVGGGLYHPSVSGGDKGNNTLNFGQLYEANVRVATLAGAAFTGASSVTSTSSSPFTITQNDDGASSGPILPLIRNSASPAASDVIGGVSFQGRDSGGNLENYASILSQILDPTSGSEDAIMDFRTVVAGTSAIRLILGHGLYTPSVTGGDKGAGSGNFGTLFAAGNQVITRVNQRVLTGSGTYTPTTGMLYCIVEGVGGGGGGGGTPVSTAGCQNGAGGGGSGAYSRSVFTAANIGASKAYACGAAGGGASAGANNGGNGGTTTFGSTMLTAPGGVGGPAASASAGAGGGAGGSAGTGTFAVNGNPGEYGMGGVTVTPYLLSGQGASSPFGGGGVGVSAAYGGQASGYGAGGGGGQDFNASGAKGGGAGSPGVIIVTEFLA